MAASLWIDTGGTFTDCVAFDGEGLRTLKVLSSGTVRVIVEAALSRTELRIQQPYAVPADFWAGWSLSRLSDQPEKVIVRASTASDGQRAITLWLESPWPKTDSKQKDLEGAALELGAGEEAPVVAARLVTGQPLGASLGDIRMRLATTRGTNALLERRGAETCFFVTRGHGDLLAIGNQARPDLFALDVKKSEPLYCRVIEVDERLDEAGNVLEKLNLATLNERVDAMVASGLRCAAVALMHSYRDPQHENLLSEYLLDRGFEFVSCSAELAPLIRIVPRAQTAVVDAYLAPVLAAYLDGVSAVARPEAIHLMTSAGGLVRADRFRPKDSLLSGPAGGVVGAANAGLMVGLTRLLAFDMGGTSTDVSRYDGDFEYDFEHSVGDATIVAPALSIQTVAAGGGSICSLRAGRLRVGPESAGASPGPACYGAGGPLTITDVNLLLGRLVPSRFGIPVDEAAAQRAFAELTQAVVREGVDTTETGELLLEGALRIADERMAAAIRRISLGRGYDPSEHVLVSFGGAGAQHACSLADLLEIQAVLVPRYASVLSAIGLGSAVIERFAHSQVLRSVKECVELPELVRELEQSARKAVQEEGIEASQIEVRRRILRLRLLGQESAIELEYETGSPLEARFQATYEELYGYPPGDRPIEIESVRVIASSRARRAESEDAAEVPSEREPPRERQRVWFSGRWHEAPIIDRTAVGRGRIEGPALLPDDHSVVVLPPQWYAEPAARGALLLKRSPGVAGSGPRLGPAERRGV